MVASGDDRRARRRARRLTLAVGLASVAAAVVATLPHAVERRTGTNGLPAKVFLPPAAARDTICQSGDRVPAGTAAVRLRAIGRPHARMPIALTLSGEDGVQDVGTAARWDGAGAIVVPLRQPLRSDTIADVCVALPGGRSQLIAFKGVPIAADQGATRNGAPVAGRMHLEYLAAGDASRWSLLPSVARRLGRGHAWSGPSVPLLVVLLMLAPIALSAWQLTRDDR